MQALPGGDMKATVAIVGCGIVGTAMGKLLGKADYHISGVAAKHLETARRAAEATGAERFSVCPWEITPGAKVIFITTPDDLIESTCMTISKHKGFEKNAVVIHCSGALSSDVLSSARDSEAMVATLHPLQSFASTDQAVSLVPGSFCTIEGDKDAMPIVRQIVEEPGRMELILIHITHANQQAVRFQGCNPVTNTVVGRLRYGTILTPGSPAMRRGTGMSEHAQSQRCERTAGRQKPAPGQVR